MDILENKRDESIVTKEEFLTIREKLREENKKVVQCHGVFDLLHPGHIEHIEEAKKLGDVLVVTITAETYVHKGPGRPYFSDELRMKCLSALKCVDYVLLSESETVMDIMEVIKPDVYAKGAEYSESKNDVTQNIDREVEKVRSLGGDVNFTEGVVFSSTKLINNNFPVLPGNVTDFIKDFANKYSFEQIQSIIEKMKDIKVLVIGDIIIDEYLFCRVQGLVSKDRAFSARFDKEEMYLGGILATAGHMSSFVDNVTVCSLIGNEPHIHSKILNDLSKDMRLDLQVDPEYKTIIKRRFVQRKGIRNEYDKLFSINYLASEDKLNTSGRADFHNKLKEIVGDFDLVMLLDYGHDLIDSKAMEIIQENSKFLALNCQTNSSNHGMNLITKYNRADTFTLDERELRLAFSSKRGDLGYLLRDLMKKLDGSQGWATKGSLGSIAVGEELELSENPAMTLSVLDTVGAGDAFFVLSSLCAYLKAPIEVGSLLGNVSGAMASNILGNSKTIKKGPFLKFISTILNY